MAAEKKISFIIFGRFTQLGIAKVRNVTECMLEMRVLVEAVGGEVTDVYYTLGNYDFVALIEAPDPNSMLKAMMDIAQIGTMRTETMIAVSPDEVSRLVKKK